MVCLYFRARPSAAYPITHLGTGSRGGMAMPAKTEQLKTDLVERVIERVRVKLEPSRADLTTRFVRQFYAHVPPDDIINETPDNLYGAALSLLGLAQQRAS